MAATTIAKTVVATGASSGLGFEAVKQLLQQSQPYKFILGARDLKSTQAAYDGLKYDAATHSVSILPLELTDLRGVRSFAQQTLDKLGKDNLDILFLNAGMNKPATGPGPNGSKWCEALVVNHLSLPHSSPRREAAPVALAARRRVVRSYPQYPGPRP
ncbi:hypothetical protein O1611_g9374 [Lasiodiplodia mahajangana]|uniref:Uncharacterized protein n=1 Tax=Lasiodiplodia mahajangana TaxID=1108764 RepID=A0ACC2JA88_9PEZI|nr:hypothetical protein O1611_g9374 [Lasiodiplodia mahajangana]